MYPTKVPQSRVMRELPVPVKRILFTTSGTTAFRGRFAFRRCMCALEQNIFSLYFEQPENEWEEYRRPFMHMKMPLV